MASANLIDTCFHLPYNPQLVERAKELRKNMTPAEKKLWNNYLRRFQFRVLRQRPIDNFIVDFYCANLKLVIEIDGEKHPDLSRRLAAAKENPALPSQQPEDYGEAVLIEDIKSAAADPKIKAAIEELAAKVEEAAQVNPNLEKAIQELTEKVKPQATTIENWQGINIKGVRNTINHPKFEFGSK
nr:DUF559 domain-containing protein [Microseira wollei]